MPPHLEDRENTPPTQETVSPARSTRYTKQYPHNIENTVKNTQKAKAALDALVSTPLRGGPEVHAARLKRAQKRLHCLQAKLRPVRRQRRDNVWVVSLQAHGGQPDPCRWPTDPLTSILDLFPSLEPVWFEREAQTPSPRRTT